MPVLVRNLYAYRNFATPIHLWLELFSLSSTASRSVAFSFLKSWLSCCYDTDFKSNSRLRNNLIDFISTATAFSKSESNSLKLLVLRYSSPRNHKAIPPPLPLQVTSWNSAVASFSILTTWKTDVLVSAMLCMCSYLIRGVRVTDLLTPRSSSGATGGVVRLSEYFNRISFLVATEILRQQEVTQQVKLLKKAIKVMHRCTDMNDMQSGAAICAGLNLSCIQRLKRPWNVLDSELRKHFDDDDRLYSPQKNWIHYRNYMHAQFKRGVPFVPYMAPLLKDLTFINDGNLDHIGGLVNWEKIELIGTSIEMFCAAQTSLPSSSHSNVEVITALQCIQPQDEENLQRLSYSHEPPRFIPIEVTSSSIDEILLRDPLSWSSTEVATFIGHHMDQLCAENFRQANIDGRQLAELTMDRMIDIGVHKLGTRKVIMRRITSITENSSSSLSPSSSIETGAKNPELWTCAEVQRWLEDIGEQELTTKFSSVNGLQLLTLDVMALELLGVATLGQRKRLAKRIQILRH